MRDRAPLEWRALGPALLRALLPAACALCGGRCDGALCAPCQAQYLGRRRPRCRQCANPLPHDCGADGGPCGRCLARPPAFDATVVAADYAAPVDQLLLQLKFGGRLALAPLFARLLRDAVLERGDVALPALLCPVPLGPRRLAERGFNQALEIARPLARALGVALHPALAARVHDTRAQSRVAPHERGLNMQQAFALAPHAAALLRGRHVGVVDDVITSGRTLGELAATLKRHGAARVTNLVFARTPPH
ncbi:ComF family protein [Janthinobacterium sp. CG_23.3]|uniref:ComF family protein n=1 Tax=Janthinobacterium sp. CG_23.3 TaxID=3349634 RepID=UPI0038D4E84A